MAQVFTTTVFTTTDEALTTARRSRNTEALLLLFVAVIVVAAFAIVEISLNQAFNPELFKYAAALVILFASAHLVVRFFAPYADPLILPIVALINGMGFVLIHRIDLGTQSPAERANGTTVSNNADQQIIWAVLGIIAFSALLYCVRDHQSLAKFGYTLGIGGIIFLAIPAILPAQYSEVNGSRIWIRIPGGFSIQPGEFSKIAIIIFTAAILVSKRELFTTAGKRILGMDFPRPRDLAPLLVAWAIAIGALVFESDLGTSLLIFSTMLTLLYVATERVSWLVIGVSLFTFGAILAYQLFPHLQIRVAIWQNPFGNNYDTYGYQIAQSLFGFASGGVFGTGLGSGQPNLVPFANTDFIFSTIGEELGVIGLAAILLLYFLLISRGIKASIAVRDSFGKLVAVGLSFTLAIQLFVVVGGVTKFIPLTGLTSPFLSYGGSSLLANYILVALLLRISNSARKPLSPKPINIDSTQLIGRA